MEQCRRLPGIFLALLFLLLPVCESLVSRRIRAEIAEIEESDLRIMTRNETYLAVLYHDNSKVWN